MGRGRRQVPGSMDATLYAARDTASAAAPEHVRSLSNLDRNTVHRLKPAGPSVLAYFITRDTPTSTIGTEEASELYRNYPRERRKMIRKQCTDCNEDGTKYNWTGSLLNKNKYL